MIIMAFDKFSREKLFEKHVRRSSTQKHTSYFALLQYLNVIFTWSTWPPQSYGRWDHCFRTCCPYVRTSPLLKSRKTKYYRKQCSLLAWLGMAVCIIDDTCFVFLKYHDGKMILYVVHVGIWHTSYNYFERKRISNLVKINLAISMTHQPHVALLWYSDRWTDTICGSMVKWDRNYTDEEK